MEEAQPLVNEDKNYGLADIVVVSDFVLATLFNHTELSMVKLRSKEIKLHSMGISSRNDHRILRNFANNWVYDLSSKGQISRLEL